jgi:hypothetical protein
LAGEGVEGEELGGGEEGGASLVDGEGDGLLVGAGPLVCGGGGELLADSGLLGLGLDADGAIVAAGAVVAGEPAVLAAGDGEEGGDEVPPDSDDCPTFLTMIPTPFTTEAILTWR